MGTSLASCLSAPAHARRSPESSLKFPSSFRGSRRELVELIPSTPSNRPNDLSARGGPESPPVHRQDLLLPMRLTAPNTTSAPAVEAASWVHVEQACGSTKLSATVIGLPM